VLPVPDSPLSSIRTVNPPVAFIHYSVAGKVGQWNESTHTAFRAGDKGAPIVSGPDHATFGDHGTQCGFRSSTHRHVQWISGECV